MVERDANGRLKPGSILNAKGRPKRTIDEATITQALEGAVPLSVVLGKLAAGIRKGDMAAIRLYLAYRWGNPVDNVDANGEIIIRFVHDGVDGTSSDLSRPTTGIQGEPG
jgi:hypothetical protein